MSGFLIPNDNKRDTKNHCYIKFHSHFDSEKTGNINFNRIDHSFETSTSLETSFIIEGGSVTTDKRIKMKLRVHKGFQLHLCIFKYIKRIY